MFENMGEFVTFDILSRNDSSVIKERRVEARLRDNRRFGGRPIEFHSQFLMTYRDVNGEWELASVSDVECTFEYADD